MALCGAVFVLGVGAGMVALFTVAVHRRLAVSATVAGLSALAQLPNTLLHPDPTMPYWSAVGIGALFIAVVTAWGMTVRARRQLVLSLRDRAHRAEAEQQLRTEQARRAERARSAREMHDVLAHRISLLSMYAGALEYRSDASPEEVTRAASVIRDSAHQALQDLREVIGVLRENAGSGSSQDGSATAGRDAPERPQPTLDDLPELVEESRQAGLRVRWVNTVSAEAERGEAPASLGRAAYRIVQEGLTNARKHAADTAVTVTLHGGPGTGLTVEVRNPLPVGEQATPSAGSGLVGLAERAAMAGGHLEHGRDDKGEFRVRAWLPRPT